MKIDITSKADENPVMFVTMTREEAIGTIKSLADQLYRREPNGGRLETWCEDGTYFSICVREDDAEDLDHG